MRDINPNGVVPDHIYQLAKFDDRVLFQANDGVTGQELWVSDGTEAGTVRVKDIASGPASSNPNGFVRFGNDAYFTADDGINGPALWKTDGTEEGTVMVKPVAAIQQLVVAVVVEGVGQSETLPAGQVQHVEIRRCVRCGFPALYPGLHGHPPHDRRGSDHERGHQQRHLPPPQ